MQGGWLRVARRSTGNYAHTYTRGPRLVDDADLRLTWDAISQALYGPGGLLARFRGSPAFAHGLLLESGLLCFGALVQATGPASKAQLVRYLDSLVARSTVAGAVDRLVRFELVESTEAGFVVASGWESTLEALIKAEAAGAARMRRNVNRWTKERGYFGDRVARGAITDLELIALKALPCVRCGGPTGQREHFPPRRFLNSYNPSVLWAICPDCNNSMSGFVRSLPEVEPPAVEEFWCAPSIDPGDLLQASTEMGIRRLYQAFDHRSEWPSGTQRWSTRRRIWVTRTISPKARAAQAIRFPLGLFRYLKDNGLLTRERAPGTKRPPGRRRQKGSARPFGDSRLPY